MVFTLADGRVLVPLPGGGGRLYESRNEFQAMLLAVLKESRISRTRETSWLPPGARLPESLPELLASVAPALSLPAMPSLNIEGVAEVEAALLRLPLERAFSAEVFLAVVAFVGEVIRIAVNGIWKSRLGTDGATWEPEVIDRNGKPCRLWGIGKELNEIGGEGSLVGFAEHRIFRVGSSGQQAPDERLSS